MSDTEKRAQLKGGEWHMSNRSLIEFNHDYSHMIEKHPEVFLTALKQYLASGRAPIVEGQRRFVFAGVRVFGMRHHSDGFDIKWGGAKASEKASHGGYQPEQGHDTQADLKSDEAHK